MDLEFLLRSGDVRRYHTWQLIRPQTTAEHQWGVAIICAHVYGGLPRAPLILAALTHDSPELLLGDIPAPVKLENTVISAAYEEAENKIRKDWGIQFNLTEEERGILSFADSMELVFFCCREVVMGNRQMLPIAARGLGMAHEKLSKLYLKRYSTSLAARDTYDIMSKFYNTVRGSYDDGK